MIEKMGVKCILFDFDGTLVNSINIMYEAYRLFMFQNGMEPTRKEFDSFNGPPLRSVVNALNDAYDFGVHDELLLAKYNEIIDSLYVKVSLCEGALKLIDNAVSRSVQIGIVTSNSRLRVENFLFRLNLVNRFNFIIADEDVSLGKPHPEPYLLALARSKMTGNQVIAVEDSEQGAKSAVAAGIRTYLLSKNRDEYGSKNIAIIDSLSSLTRILFVKN